MTERLWYAAYGALAGSMFAMGLCFIAIGVLWPVDGGLGRKAALGLVFMACAGFVWRILPPPRDAGRDALRTERGTER